MAILLIEATSTSAADNIVAAVQAGTLWGVSMGTTSSASSYSDKALVECTITRAIKIEEACPEGFEVPVMDMEPPSFTAAGPNSQVWFLRGML